jgi:hypothetical protein
MGGSTHRGRIKKAREEGESLPEATCFSETLYKIFLKVNIINAVNKAHEKIYMSNYQINM